MTFSSFSTKNNEFKLVIGDFVQWIKSNTKTLYHLFEDGGIGGLYTEQSKKTISAMHFSDSQIEIINKANEYITKCILFLAKKNKFEDYDEVYHISDVEQVNIKIVKAFQAYCDIYVAPVIAKLKEQKPKELAPIAKSKEKEVPAPVTVVTPVVPVVPKATASTVMEGPSAVFSQDLSGLVNDIKELNNAPSHTGAFKTTREFYTPNATIIANLDIVCKASTIQSAYDILLGQITELKNISGVDHVRAYLTIRFQAGFIFQQNAKKLISEKNIAEQKKLLTASSNLFVALDFVYSPEGKASVWKWFFSNDADLYGKKYSRAQIFELYLRKSVDSYFELLRAMYAKLGISFHASKTSEDITSVLASAKDQYFVSKKKQSVALSKNAEDKALNIELVTKGLTKAKAPHSWLPAMLPMSDHDDDYFNFGISDEDRCTLKNLLVMLYPGLASKAFSEKIQAMVVQINNARVRGDDLPANVKKPNPEFSVKPSDAYGLFYSDVFTPIENSIAPALGGNDNKIRDPSDALRLQIARASAGFPLQFIASIWTIMAQQIRPAISQSTTYIFDGNGKFNSSMKALIDIDIKSYVDGTAGAMDLMVYAQNGNPMKVDKAYLEEHQVGLYLKTLKTIESQGTGFSKFFIQDLTPNRNPFVIMSVSAPAVNAWKFVGGSWADEIAPATPVVSAPIVPTPVAEKTISIMKMKKEPTSASRSGVPKVQRSADEEFTAHLNDMYARIEARSTETAEDKLRKSKKQHQRNLQEQDPATKYTPLAEYLRENGLTPTDFFSNMRLIFETEADDVIEDMKTEMRVKTEFDLRAPLRKTTIRERFLQRLASTTEADATALVAICKHFKFSSNEELKQWFINNGANDKQVMSKRERTKIEQTNRANDLLNIASTSQEGPSLVQVSQVRTGPSETMKALLAQQDGLLGDCSFADDIDLKKVNSNAIMRLHSRFKSSFEKKVIRESVASLRLSANASFTDLVDFVRKRNSLEMSQDEMEFISAEIPEKFISIVEKSLDILEKIPEMICQLEVSDHYEMFSILASADESVLEFADFVAGDSKYIMSLPHNVIKFINSWVTIMSTEEITSDYTSHLALFISQFRKLNPTQDILTWTKKVIVPLIYECGDSFCFPYDSRNENAGNISRSLQQRDVDDLLRNMFATLYHLIFLENPYITYTEITNGIEAFIIEGKSFQNFDDLINDMMDYMKDIGITSTASFLRALTGFHNTMCDLTCVSEPVLLAVCGRSDPYAYLPLAHKLASDNGVYTQAESAYITAKGAMKGALTVPCEFLVDFVTYMTSLHLIVSVGEFAQEFARRLLPFLEESIDADNLSDIIHVKYQIFSTSF